MRPWTQRPQASRRGMQMTEMTTSAPEDLKGPQAVTEPREVVTQECHSCHTQEWESYRPNAEDDDEDAAFERLRDDLDLEGWRLDERTGYKFRENYCPNCWVQFQEDNPTYHQNKRYVEASGQGRERYTYEELGMEIPESAHRDEEFDRA